MRFAIGVTAALFAVCARAQQVPFIAVTGPNAPKGASFLLLDNLRGGIWMGGMVEGTEGLTYFDGSRFFSPLKTTFPKVVISGMVEDSEGGIWLATSGGVYRAFREDLLRVADGSAQGGIFRAASDVFLSAVTKRGTQDVELIRLARTATGGWKTDVVMPLAIRSGFQADGDGNILYLCEAAIASSMPAMWRSGVQELTFHSSGIEMSRWRRTRDPLSYAEIGDVKPENVIVRNLGLAEQAVLIDFSIAIIKDVNETLHGISRAAGTFDYMAPEQALGYAEPSSDVFSLAKVVMEMLGGVRLSRRLLNVALDLPGRVLEILERSEFPLSRESKEMVARALEFDPSKRPRRASEFARGIVRDLRE